jgi:hypothetical protein
MDKKLVLLLSSCLLIFTVNSKVSAQIPSKVFEISSILVDACSAPEGENEMVYFQIGPNPVNITDLRVDGAGAAGFPKTIGAWPNTFNPWQGVATPPAKPTEINTINNSIICGGKLIEPIGGILPRGAKVLMITSTNFNTLAHSFATLTDTLYVIFQISGNTNGHFANYGAAPSPRTLILMHTPTNLGDTVTYNINYLRDQFGLTNLPMDGASVAFDWAGDTTYFNNGCQAPYPILTATANPPVICEGASSTLNANFSSTGTTYSWMPGNINGASVLVTPVSTTTYTITANHNGCTSTATVTVTVTPNVSPTINCGVSTTSSVSYDWAALPGATGYSVTYQLNTGPVVNQGPIGNILTYGVSGLTAGDNVTLTVTPTGGAGTCFAPSSNICSATFCTSPTANTSYALCASITTPIAVTLTGSGAYFGGTYSAVPAGLSIDASTGTITPSASFAGTYTVSYTVPSVPGCPGTTATTSVTINAVITPAFNPVAPITIGTTLLPLPITSNNGITGTWTPALNNLATTTYTFTPNAGQCATSTTLTITVNP